MHWNDAKQALGLTGVHIDAVTVRKAWAEAVKRTHPDTATDSRNVTYSEKLTEARDFLLAALAGADLACKLCNGTGKVRASLGARECAACNGTGDRAS
jgi:DnaJ-class molecular chaperone